MNDEQPATPQPAEPVAWRHNLTHCLYETAEEVQLADADSWAEPLYLGPPSTAPSVRVCCQDFEKCSELCVPRASYWQGQVTQLRTGQGVDELLLREAQAEGYDTLRGYVAALKQSSATYFAERNSARDAWRRARAEVDAATPQQPAAASAGAALTLTCGHPASLMLKSTETGEPLYCELCDAQSGRRDAEAMESELRAKLANAEETIGNLTLALREEVESQTFMGEPVASYVASRNGCAACKSRMAELCAALQSPPVATTQESEALFLVCAGGDAYSSEIVPESKLDDAYLLTQWGSLGDIDAEERRVALEHFHDADEWTYIDPLRGGKGRIAVEFSISFEDGWARVIRLPAHPAAGEATERAAARVPTVATPAMIEAFAGQLEGSCGSFFDWERGGDEAYAAMLAAADAATR